MQLLTFSRYLKQRFPFPVRKLPIHTFLGCPHRKGAIGEGGCFYCNNSSFSNLSMQKKVGVFDQIRSGINRARTSGYKGKFIAYYQTYTNTFAPAKVLENLFAPVYEFRDDIVGISVSTRPDCLPDQTLELLNRLGKDFMLWLEIGLQSANDNTLKLINRGHDYACFVDAVKRAKKYPNLLLCAHIILGLPGESREDMFYTITEVRRLALGGIKIHHLQVVKGTVFAEWYRQGKIKVMDWPEYMDLLLYLLPFLGENIVIHRLINECPQDLLIAPKWNISKQEFLQRLYANLHRLQ